MHRWYDIRDTIKHCLLNTWITVHAKFTMVGNIVGKGTHDSSMSNTLFVAVMIGLLADAKFAAAAGSSRGTISDI